MKKYNRPDNPLVFARPFSNKNFKADEIYGHQQGITLLDQYAGDIIKSLVGSYPGLDKKAVSKQAFDIAEEMLIARENKLEEIEEKSRKDL